MRAYNVSHYTIVGVTRSSEGTSVEGGRKGINRHVNFGGLFHGIHNQKRLWVFLVNDPCAAEVTRTQSKLGQIVKTDVFNFLKHEAIVQ